MTDWDATLLIGSSFTDPDIHYATKFYSHKNFIYLKTKDQDIMVITSKFAEQAAKDSPVKKIISFEEILPIEEFMKTESEWGNSFDPMKYYTEVTDKLLRKHHVTNILVPQNFWFGLSEMFKAKGYNLMAHKDNSVFPERAVKDKREIKLIRDVQKATEDAMSLAISTIRNSIIKRGKLYYGKEELTSESIRNLIQVKLMAHGCFARQVIVACGNDAIGPHNLGQGILKANEPIVIDIFPYSIETGFHADMTRTVLKGEPSEELVRLYDTVLKGQEMALKMIKGGVKAGKIHEAVSDFFEKNGYENHENEGVRQGFTHGLGHGIGLNIHEPPSLGKTEDTLPIGAVVTVEPGLYYLNKGAVRIEDMVLVTKRGCKNLTNYPKKLVLD